MIIRQIHQNDNAQIAKVIRDVLIEHDVPNVGTAYADPQLDYMFEAYGSARAAYFIIEKADKIIGGAGVGQLENESAEICELQKMYFLPEARGLGLGHGMMEQCLTAAKRFGYSKCYLETMPYMKDAQKLYLRSGFEFIDAPMGNTGHTSCPVWMIRDL